MFDKITLGAALTLAFAASASAQQAQAPATEAPQETAPAEAPAPEAGAADSAADGASGAPAGSAPDAAPEAAADAAPEAATAGDVAQAAPPEAAASGDQPGTEDAAEGVEPGAPVGGTAPIEGAGEVEAEEQTADEATDTDEAAGDHSAAAEDHGEDGGHTADAGHAESHVTDYAFSFEGPFGAFDQAQLQRGLQIYTEVCAACHGLSYVPIRTLSDEHGPGLPEDQVRAYADFWEVFDPTLNEGEGDYRPATPNDNFPRSAMASAPDLSLMAKARAGFHGPYGLGLNQLFRGMGGAEYTASLLTGYTGETKEEAGVTLYENTAFPGGWISMPQPLYGDDIAFADGHPADLESEAKDVAAFLMWTAEPKMMQRKQAGFSAVLMLGLLAVLLYFTNKSVWAPLKKRPAAPAE